MKLSKEELKKKIDEKISDEDVKIELLEDIEDSMDVEDTSEKVEKTAYDEVVAERDEIKRKYKERFLNGSEESEEKEDDEEELKEEEVIDVKEI
jgi:ferritin-like metal-binding protein YciE